MYLGDGPLPIVLSRSPFMPFHRPEHQTIFQYIQKKRRKGWCCICQRDILNIENTGQVFCKEEDWQLIAKEIQMMGKVLVILTIAILATIPIGGIIILYMVLQHLKQKQLEEKKLKKLPGKKD